MSSTKMYVLGTRTTEVKMSFFKYVEKANKNHMRPGKY